MFAFNSHDDFTIESVIKKIENAKTGNGIVTGQPLFNSKAEYEEFILNDIKKCDLEYADLHTYKGNATLALTQVRPLLSLFLSLRTAVFCISTIPQIRVSLLTELQIN